MKKIKVLETIRQGFIGGGESHVIDLVEGMNKERFEPIVLSFTGGPMVDKLQSMGIKTYVVETTKPFNVFISSKVEEIMKREGIQLLHAHGTRAYSNTFIAARKLGIPIIYTVHGWSFHNDQKKLIKAIRTKSEALLVKKADKVICVSDSNLADGRSLFPIINGTVIKNGINQLKFNPENSYKDIRSELGIDKDTLLVGFIARITKQKDPLTFIQALKHIPADVNIKFLMVGEGDLKEEAVQLAADLNVKDRIIFQNFRQDVPDILNAIDIYCLPSLWEGLSIALLEAMAMKKVIVATAVDGTKEVIKNNENGVLINLKDSENLATTIINLSKNEQERKRLAQNAYNTISTDFSTVAMIRKTEQVYTDVLEKNNISKS